MSANSQKTDGKYPNRFKKGQSGNPKGRPKMKPEERDALAMIRSLAPEAADTLQSILHSDTAPPAAKIRAAEIILDRTYGKAEATVNVLATDYSALDEAFEAMGNDTA